MLTLKLRILAVAVLVVIGPACNLFDPCDRLSDRICDCEATEGLRQVCRQRVEKQKDQYDTDEAHRAACDKALETCTCDAIDNLDLAACGFAR